MTTTTIFAQKVQFYKAPFYFSWENENDLVVTGNRVKWLKIPEM